jgi:hypothetical protein
MLLSLQHSLPRAHHGEEPDLPIDGTGLLHAIWLYRKHPELELLLEQVAHPTDNNLRLAGMVRTRLVEPSLGETESQEVSQVTRGASSFSSFKSTGGAESKHHCTGCSCQSG